MSTGKFIISLDFELYWGVRDQLTLKKYGENILGARKMMPDLLMLFDKYNIRATFATVGFLFCTTKEELLSCLPKKQPTYHVKTFSPYGEYLNHVGQNEDADPLHFAPGLISIIAARGHEIASHTFSHFYCLESGVTLQDFEEDLKAAIQLATKSNYILKTIIFPRNQFKKEHLKICAKYGFTTYRGNEESPIYQWRKIDKENYFRKILRLADSYLNLTGHHTFYINPHLGEMTNIPASKFLRPYHPLLRFLDPFKLRRIKRSMTEAARDGKCYHLWWHPHNFGKYTTENLFFLQAILEHYKELQTRYNFQNCIMGACEKG